MEMLVLISIREANTRTTCCLSSTPWLSAQELKSTASWEESHRKSLAPQITLTEERT